MKCGRRDGVPACPFDSSFRRSFRFCLRHPRPPDSMVKSGSATAALGANAGRSGSGVASSAPLLTLPDARDLTTLTKLTPLGLSAPARQLTSAMAWAMVIALRWASWSGDSGAIFFFSGGRRPRRARWPRCLPGGGLAMLTRVLRGWAPDMSWGGGRSRGGP